MYYVRCKIYDFVLFYVFFKVFKIGFDFKAIWFQMNA